MPQTIRTVPDNIRAPYIEQGAIGFDRQLPKNTAVSVNYLYSRGVHQFRTLSLAQTPDPTSEALVSRNYMYDTTGTSSSNS